MHIRGIQISALRKPSGDGRMEKPTAFNLCLSTGGEYSLAHMRLPHKFCHFALGMVVSCLNVNKTKFRPL